MGSALIVGEQAQTEDLAQYVRSAGHRVRCTSMAGAVESIWICCPDLVVLLGDAVEDGGVGIRDDLLREPASATTPLLAVYSGRARPEKGYDHVATIAPVLGERRIGLAIAGLLTDVVDEKNRGVALRSLTSAVLYRVEREVVFSVPPAVAAERRSSQGSGPQPPAAGVDQGRGSGVAESWDEVDGGAGVSSEAGGPPGASDGSHGDPSWFAAVAAPPADDRGGACDTIDEVGGARLASGFRGPVGVDEPHVLDALDGVGPEAYLDEEEAREDALADLAISDPGLEAATHGATSSSRPRRRNVWPARIFGMMAMVTAALMILYGLRLQRQQGLSDGRTAARSILVR